jgi:hypothetical protein
VNANANERPTMFLVDMVLSLSSGLVVERRDEQSRPACVNEEQALCPAPTAEFRGFGAESSRFLCVQGS